jgi:hypothetical protein
MFEHDKDADKKQLSSQYIQEKPKVAVRKIKQTTKYVVSKPGKDYAQDNRPAREEPIGETLELAAAGTVFDNVYYPHLLMQRKYFID